MKCQKFQTELGMLEFSSWGSGFPILVLHGAHSNCHERLVHRGIDLKKYRIITPSRPGYGETTLSKKVTPEEAAKQIIELLQFLRIDSFIVYGVSAGGLTALALASLYPEMVSKLILASAVTKNWLSPKDKKYKIASTLFHPRTEAFTWKITRFCARIAPNFIARSFQKQFSTKIISSISEKETNSLIRALEKYRSYLGFRNDLEQDLDPEIIQKIKCSTLIIHSHYDNSVPLDHAYHAKHHIPDSRIEILYNDWGHLIWVGKNSQNSINKIVSFLEEV